MPHSPLYVPLLTDEAQWAIGQLHPVGELPFSILIDEGFDTETYVDIFDGGPTVDARVAMLKSVARSRSARAVVQTANAEGQWHLVASTQRSAFAAVLRRALPGAEHIALDSPTAARLGDAPLRVAALEGEPA